MRLPRRSLADAAVLVCLVPAALQAQADPRLDDLEDEVLQMVEADAEMVQEIVHFSEPVAEVTHASTERVGLPEWSSDDVLLATSLQRELGQEEPEQLSTEVNDLGGPVDLSRPLGGGSDDIADVSWNMPTVTLRYPANMPGLPGHNWANGITMATPIAHKGSHAGAKVQALTLLDLLLDGETVDAARAYFNDEQTAKTTYTPFISDTDEPAIWLNEDIMATWRERMRPYYYDPDRYDSYLEQLGIEYPTVRNRPVSEQP